MQLSKPRLTSASAVQVHRTVRLLGDPAGLSVFVEDHASRALLMNRVPSPIGLREHERAAEAVVRWEPHGNRRSFFDSARCSP
jgi:hypothetical protein